MSESRALSVTDATCRILPRSRCHSVMCGRLGGDDDDDASTLWLWLLLRGDGRESGDRITAGSTKYLLGRRAAGRQARTQKGR